MHVSTTEPLDLSKTLVLFRASGSIFTGRGFVVPKSVSVIGRLSECDISIPDATVSRQHCEISLCPEGVQVRDLGSVNGTWVEDRMVDEALLRPGQSFRLGDVELTVETRPINEPRTQRISFPSRPFKATTEIMGMNKRAPITYDSIKESQTKNRSFFGLMKGR